MSDFSLLAVILSNTSRDRAAAVLAQALSVLVDEYQFGFRGWGGEFRLVFEGEKYKWEESVPALFSSAATIDTDGVKRLAQDYRWFEISGSIRIPGRLRLYDLSLILYPSFDRTQPACPVFRLDSALYHDVYDEDDEFDPDAADTLRRLAVRLGANDQVDGFKMLLVGSLAEIKPFDVPTLRQNFLKPTPIQDLIKGEGSPPGLIMGIKSSLLPLAMISQVWVAGNNYETVTGFSIRDGLIPIDDDYVDEGEHEDT